jgi:hypothetical protein
MHAHREQHKRNAEARLRIGDAWQDYDLVFPSAMATPLDGPNVYHAFRRLLRDTGLPTSYRVHDLRHSTATYLLVAGVDPRIVMQIMGWSQVSMLKRYQHRAPSPARRRRRATGSCVADDRVPAVNQPRPQLNLILRGVSGDGTTYHIAPFYGPLPADPARDPLVEPASS